MEAPGNAFTKLYVITVNREREWFVNFNKQLARTQLASEHGTAATLPGTLPGWFVCHPTRLAKVTTGTE